MVRISYCPKPLFHGPVQLPAVASSSAPSALVPGHACSELPSLITGAVVVVTAVGASLVSDSPSTRTVTVAGPAATAVEASTSSETQAPRSAGVMRGERCMEPTPFHEGLVGFGP